MKWTRLKFKISKVCWIIGVAFWLLETIVFLFLDGWHLRAVSVEEKLCDQVAANLCQVGFLLFALSVFDIHEKILNPKN